MATVITNYASYVVGGDWAFAFQKAINDIKAFHVTNSTGTEGGVIEIPKGRYSIKSPVYFDNGIAFSGEGNGIDASDGEHGCF